MRATEVRFDNISKRFGEVAALVDFTLSVAPGEFVTLLGASGSGKSTALNILAGFAEPSAGHLKIGGREVTGLPPEERNVGMVFQNFALFPHMTVFDNVAFPLRMRRRPAAEIRRLVGEALEVVRLSGLSDRHPGALSGGQRQRVALARAVVFSPPVLLMDECLSALDLKLREELQGEIRRIHRDIGATTIFVTHDQGEALTMSDRVAVLNRGRIEQLDRPEILYDRPATRFVADFIGQTNLLEAGPAEGGVALPALGATLPGRHGAVAGVSLRPERILRAERLAGEADVTRFFATLSETAFLGATLEHRLRLDGGQMLIMRESRSGAIDLPEPGDTVALAFRNADAVVLTDH